MAAAAGLRAWVRASLIGAGLVFVMTTPTITGLTTAGRLDTNDGRHGIWNVAWIGHALLSPSASVFDANIFHPHTGTLAYSELNLVAGLLGLPWYAATGSPLAAYNGAAATGLVLAFVLMWTLVRRLTESDAAGLVSATAFTFCPYVAARTPHIQLLMIFVFPLVLLAFHRMAERPGAWRGVQLGASLAVAALACGYYGLFAGCVLGLVSLLFAQRRRAYWVGLAVALLMASILVAPVFGAFSAARAASGADVRPWDAQDAANYSANLSAYFASPTFAHQWWLPALGRWQPWSEVLFPGAALLLFAGLALRLTRSDPGRRRVVAVYGAVAIASVWASFGPQGGLYLVLFHTVPGLSMLRAPSRLGIVVTFALAIMAGYSVAHLARRWRWLPAVLVVVLVCELGVKTTEWGWPSWPLRTTAPLSPAYQRLAELPRAPLVEYPFPYVSSNFHNHAHAMYWSTYHWQPLVNGYSDLIPADFRQIALPINGFPDPASFEIMRERGVRYVLWHVDTYNPEARAVLEERMARYADYLQPIVQTETDWLFEIAGYPDRVTPE